MIVELQENSDGELILPISDEMVSQLGWSDGTKLKWVDNYDGSFTVCEHDDE